MPSNHFSDISLAGSVTVVPEKIRSIEADTELFGGNVRQIERLKKTLGLNERRIAEASVTALDLSQQAAESLLASHSLSAEALDGILFVTQTPDHSQPSNASLMHRKLGCASHCAALDVNLGCSGYVYALWLAFSLIANGSSSKILVCAGDTLSRMVHPKDRSVAALFGDAGSATLIEKRAGAGPSWFRLGSDGSGSEALIVPAGGARMPLSAETSVEQSDAEGNIRCLENLHMQGSEVFNFSIEVVPREIEALLAEANCPIDSVNFFVLHQANRYIVHSIGKRLKVDLKRCPIASFEAFGNVSSASIPGALAYELSECLLGEERQRLLLSGFGVGLSWASCLLDIEGMQSLRWELYSGGGD